jgi:hypothetical protein
MHPRQAIPVFEQVALTHLLDRLIVFTAVPALGLAGVADLQTPDTVLEQRCQVDAGRRDSAQGILLRHRCDWFVQSALPILSGGQLDGVSPAQRAYGS